MLVNKGIGGTSSGVYAACAEQMVGQVGGCASGRQPCMPCLAHTAGRPHLCSLALAHTTAPGRAGLCCVVSGSSLPVKPRHLPERSWPQLHPAPPQDPDLIVVEFTGGRVGRKSRLHGGTQRRQRAGQGWNVAQPAALRALLVSSPALP